MPANPTTNQPNTENQAVTYALGAVCLWSTVATGFKLGLAVLAVEQLLLLGTAISWLIFLAYAYLDGRFALNPEDRWLTVLLGVINPFAYYLILFAAYERLPAHIAQPLNYTWAITLALLAVPILKQPLTLRALSGILVSYIGVIVLLGTAERAEQDGWDLTGVSLALLSTLLWASYWLVNTRARSQPAAIMFWSFTAALPLVTGACLLGPGLPTLTLTHMGFGLWVGGIEMGFTFLLWQNALRKTAHAGRISQLIFLSPFLSLVIIHFVLDEHIGPGVIIALLIIVVGLRIARVP